MSNFLKLESESIFIDNLQLIYSKSFIANNPRQIKITTRESNSDDQCGSNTPRITLTLNYYPSNREKKNYIESQIKNASNINFTIFGFDEYNRISTQIAPLGSYYNNTLYFSYCAQRINQNAVEISIQLYLEGTINV